MAFYKSTFITLILTKNITQCRKTKLKLFFTRITHRFCIKNQSALFCETI